MSTLFYALKKGQDIKVNALVSVITSYSIHYTKLYESGCLNILVSAYLDKNIGDDLMIKVLAKKLSGHKVHLICTDRSLFVPFEGLNNIEMVTPPNSLIKRLEFYKQYDLFIKIGGSIFISYNFV